MPFCTAGGLRFHYRILGQGQPLVLIMGLAGDLTWWHPLDRELAKDFRLLLFDNRGAGLTDKPDERYTIAMLAADTAALMEVTGFKRAHVFGVSMGGMIAQELALRYPDRVDYLVLGCTHAGGRGFIMPSADAVRSMTLTRGKSLEQIARQTMTILFGPRFREEHPEIIEDRIRRYMERPPPRGPFSQQFWAVLGHDCYERLPEIRKPTLILAGEADVLIPPQNAEILRSRIPGAQLVTLAGAGHAFFVEAPVETARIVRRHLTAAGSSSFNQDFSPVAE